MFSVNVDKLIKMTPEETIGYSNTADNILQKIEDDCRSLAVVGGEIDALKLASTFMEKGKKALFIDANYDTAVFLGKYKLGKDLKGFTDYVLENESAENLICVTNREQLDIVFTGKVPKSFLLRRDRMKDLLAQFEKTYDMVIVLSDKAGNVASCCDRTILMMNQTEYSEIASSIKVNELNNKGCLVLGVVINE